MWTTESRTWEVGMATLDLAGAEAQRRLKESNVAHWCSGWDTTPASDTAWARLQEDLFTPFVDAKFGIQPDDALFAIGSCFARGIEVRLQTMGYEVESRSTSFEHFEMRRTGWPHDYTNKYNP